MVVIKMKKAAKIMEAMIPPAKIAALPNPANPPLSSTCMVCRCTGPEDQMRLPESSDNSNSTVRSSTSAPSEISHSIEPVCAGPGFEAGRSRTISPFCDLGRQSINTDSGICDDRFTVIGIVESVVTLMWNVRIESGSNWIEGSKFQTADKLRF